MVKGFLCFQHDRNPVRERKTRKILFGSVLVLSVLFSVVACFHAGADDAPVLEVTEKTNPKIVELYQKLQDKNAEIADIESERTDALVTNANAMQEKEQSLENKTLTATTTAATGLGAIEAASAYAEKNADETAERDMAAYLATMHCEYSGGKSGKYGNAEVVLPGGNELGEYYTEYKTLAEKVAQTKSALGLAPGIETEKVLERAASGLYEYQSVGIQSGAYTSVSRALLDSDSEDAKTMAAQKQETTDKLKSGLTALGGGIVAGIVGNMTINKDAPKESSDKINQEYDSKVSEKTKEKTQIEKDLTAAIEENRRRVQAYNQQVGLLRTQVEEIQSAPSDCRDLFAHFITKVSGLELIENETDFVDVVLPEMDSDLLQKCIQCKNKLAVFYPDTKECECPPERPDEKDGKCVEKIVQIEPIISQPQTDNVIVSPVENIENIENQNDPEICSVGLKHTAGFGIVAGETRVGDRCTSALVLDGVVFKRKNGTCGCSAQVCETRNGRAAIAKGGVCVCDTDRGYKDDKGKCVCDEEKGYKKDAKGQCVNSGTVSVTTDAGTSPTESTEPTEPQKTYKYYNCGNENKGKDNWDTDTKKAKPGIQCEWVGNVFNRRNVTPMEADGLMKEWALEKYKDKIECDNVSHRSQDEKKSYGDKWRNCVSVGAKEKYYEFAFNSLSNGNNGFTEALCSIYGLHQSGLKSACKKSTKETCDKISAAVGRIFVPDGKAVLQGSECVITQHSNATSAIASGLQGQTTTKDDLHTIQGVDPLYFYDKELQISANSDVYKSIIKYLFQDVKLGVKEFSCSSGFSDNIRYFKGTKQDANDIMQARKKCMQDIDDIDSDAEIQACYAAHSIDTISGDLLSCKYGDNGVDFLFKKLDARWNKKSTGGYQNLWCLNEGGTFSGKSCALADKQKCDDFQKRFLQQYPNSKGMKWDDELGCILKDAKEVHTIRKVAETTGFVAVTLVTAVAGGPIVWGLSAVEASALVTEAVTEDALNDWSTKFITAAARCPDNDSACANRVFKEHIARIIKGSKYFTDTQGRAIARQTERLTGMLSVETLNAIDDQGRIDLQNGKDRDTVLEDSILNYYGTKLTSGEKSLLAAKKISTVLTFATLAGAGIMAGLRQAVKRNWIKLSPERQLRWVEKWKILKPDDVTALTPKATEAIPTMERSQAVELEKLNSRISELEAKTNRTADEAAELKRLRQERNTILNKVGTKDADEVARMRAAAYNPEIEAAQRDYQNLLKEREALAKRMGTNRQPGKVELQDMDRRIAAAEKRLQDLGAEVEPVEPLWKNNTAAPKKETTPKSDSAKPNTETPESKPVGGEAPGASTPRSAVREKLGDKINSNIEDIKSGKYKEMHVPRNQLSDDEWKILQEELANEGLEVKQEGSIYFVIRKPNNAATGAAGHGAANNVDDAARGAGNATAQTAKTAQQALEDLKKLGFKEYKDGVFIASTKVDENALMHTPNISFASLNKGGTLDSKDKIFIAIQDEVGSKLGTYEIGTHDFVRPIAQNKRNIQKINQVISNRTPITKIKGHNVYITQFGRQGDKGIAKIEVAGRELPFYVSTGSSGKTKVPTGKWEFFGGQSGQWLNKGSIDEILAHYNSPELEEIAHALDNVIGDIRDKECILKTYGRNYLGGTGNVAEVSTDVPAARFDINQGLKYTPDYTESENPTNFYKNLNEIKSWFKNLKPENTASAGRGAANNVDDAARVVGSSAARGATNNANNIAALRRRASTSFEQYLAQVKQSKTGRGAKLPKSRLNDAEWSTLNASLAKEDVQLVEITENGKTYMQFRRADATDDAADIARGGTAGGRNVFPKTDKINIARSNGNLGYHGTDVDIPTTDMIRPSANTSNLAGQVQYGYGVAKDYDAAEKYAVKRLIERQNVGKNISFMRDSNNTLVVQAGEPLNLSNKTGYVYTTAKDSSMQWEPLSNLYVGKFYAAQMPNAVEILDKVVFNLDDLIRSGRVRIVTP